MQVEEGQGRGMAGEAPSRGLGSLEEERMQHRMELRWAVWLSGRVHICMKYERGIKCKGGFKPHCQQRSRHGVACARYK